MHEIDLEPKELVKVHTAGMLVISKMMPLDSANEARSHHQREDQKVKVLRMEEEEDAMIRHLEESYLKPILERIE